MPTTLEQDLIRYFFSHNYTANATIVDRRPPHPCPIDLLGILEFLEAKIGFWHAVFPVCGTRIEAC